MRVKHAPYKAYTVPADIAEPLEQSRFENGGLQDSEGYLYPIVSNTESSLVVEQGNNPVPPASNALVWFWDDDQLRDGQDVPMPDITQLRNAMAEAYVEVTDDPPIIGIDNDYVDFRANLEESDYLDVADWDSWMFNGDAYWVTYLLGAFQGHPDEDNDPDAEGSQGLPYGLTSRSGGSAVFLETIRDAARELHEDAARLELDAVVGQIGRAVARVHRDPLNRPVTKWPVEPARYSDLYLWWIRISPKPL